MQKLLKQLARILPTNIAYAHCDYPCGIYDPHHAQIGALTVIRMDDLMKELLDQAGDHSELETRSNIIRAVAIKEDHAEMVKKEVRTIWGDYFKPETKDKYPDLDKLVHEIMQLGSKAKQTVDRDNAMKLLDKVNQFAEIFWQSKGKEVKRVKAPYKPEEEMVIPILD